MQQAWRGMKTAHSILVWKLERKTGTGNSRHRRECKMNVG